MNPLVKKPDSASLAQEDFFSSYTVWDQPVLKPGEKSIVDYYSLQKKKLDKKVTIYQRQLAQLQLTGENVFNTPVNDNPAYMDLIQNTSIQIEVLEQKVTDLMERGKKIDSILQLHLANYPHLRKNENITNSVEKNDASKKGVKPWYGKKGGYISRQIFPILFLVAFCTFDAINMYMNMANYEYTPVRNGAMALIVFIGVLSTSLEVKRRSTMLSWIVFLFFLSGACATQFLGRDPMFSVKHVTDSPLRVFALPISFFGSILVTILNIFVRKEQIKNSPQEPVAQIAIENGTEDEIELKAKKRLAEYDTSLHSVNKEITEHKNKIKEKQVLIEETYRRINDENTLRIEQQVDASNKLGEKKEEILDMIEITTTMLEDVQDKFSQQLSEYRKEVEILQILHGTESNTKYQDRSTITI